MEKPKKKIRQKKHDLSKNIIKHYVNNQELVGPPKIKIDANKYVSIYKEDLKKLLFALGRKKARLAKNAKTTKENSTFPKADKEQIIKDLMEFGDYTRTKAEFFAAVELGESNANVIKFEENKPK